jgi:hypothetical protein
MASQDEEAAALAAELAALKAELGLLDEGPGQGATDRGFRGVT